MRSLKVLAAAAVLATSAATVNAGGLLVTPPTPEVVKVIPAEPVETSSINSGYIVLGLLAALVAASASF